MNRRIVRCGTGLLSLAVAGCVSDGLSPHESNPQRLTALTYSFAREAEIHAQPGPPPVVKFPLSVVVSQVGEITPPEALLTALAADQLSFRLVQSIPASNDGTYEEVEKMEGLARDMGADALLVVGGSVDYGAQTTGLSVFDLTIIGAFIVPSRDIQADAKATGTLIDLRTGRVAQTFSAEAHRSVLAPAVGVNEGQVRLLQDIRQDVVNELARRITASCAARRKADVASASR